MSLLNAGLLPLHKRSVIYSQFKHPQSVCMSYFEHCMFSLKLAGCFAVGSLKAVIHAFFPNMYVTSSTDLLSAMKEDMAKIGCHQDEKEEEVKSWTNRGTYVSEKDDNDIPACFF